MFKLNNFSFSFPSKGINTKNLDYNKSIFITSLQAQDLALDLVLKEKITYLKELGYSHLKPKIICFDSIISPNYGLNSIPYSSSSIYSYFEIHKFRSPKIFFPLIEKNLYSLREAEDQIIQQIEHLLKNSSLLIAAILIEPLQFSSFNILRNTFLEKLKNLSQYYNVSLIFDYSTLKTTRFGSFLYQSPIQADISIYNFEEVAFGIELNKEKFAEFLIPSASELQIAYLNSFAQQLSIDFFEQLEINGFYFQQRFELLAKRFQKAISNIRRKGLLLAFDVNRTKIYEQLNFNPLLKQLQFPSFCFYPNHLLSTIEIDQIIEDFEGILQKITS